MKLRLGLRLSLLLIFVLAQSYSVYLVHNDPEHDLVAVEYISLAILVFAFLASHQRQGQEDHKPQGHAALSFITPAGLA